VRSGVAVLQRQRAGRVEQDVDDDPLGRREDDVLDELLVLDPAAVAADELHPRARQRDLEYARVRRVGEVEAHDFAGPGGEGEPRFAGDQQHVAEAAHRRVGGLVGAEGGDLAVFDEHVVERQRELTVGRRPVVRVGGDHDAVAIQAQLLPVVLADVRVIPVDARVGEGHAGGVAATDGHELLRLVRAVVAVVQPQPMPVNRGLQVALVLYVDDDLRAFGDAQRRTRDGAVVGEHSHGGVTDALGHRRETQTRSGHRRRA
jgi:hypothetical protein